MSSTEQDPMLHHQEEQEDENDTTSCCIQQDSTVENHPTHDNDKHNKNEEDNDNPQYQEKDHQDDHHHPCPLDLSSYSPDELRARLHQLQQRRHVVEQTRRDQAAIKARLQHHYHACQHEFDLQQAEVRAWKLRHHLAAAQLKDSQHWNAMNDAFVIWHQGPFATINGIRLGAEATVVVPAVNNNTPTKSGDEGSSSTVLGVMAYPFTLPGRYLGFSSSAAEPTPTTSNANTTNNNITENNNNNNNNSNNNPSPTSSAPTTITTTIKVPWRDINSALGQIVLLLKLLEQTPHAGISFPNHVLIPQGSTSKIGLRQPNAITGWGIGSSASSSGEIPIVALYHLYSDDSFSLFGKRNFNLALRALVECVALAAKAIHARDRTIVMPFPMVVEHDNPSAPCTVGGLPVQYGSTTTTPAASSSTDVDGTNATTTSAGVTWTRAMKYLLTNVKWCVAFTAKHVDR